MKYDEYMEKHGIGFAHDGYEGGEASTDTLQGLLEVLKEKKIECPENAIGLTPSLITIDPHHAIDGLEQILIESEYAGEDYEMPAEGKEFLKKCFEEYNDNYATEGNYYEGVTVEVPEEMKYELEVHDETCKAIGKCGGCERVISTRTASVYCKYCGNMVDWGNDDE